MEISIIVPIYNKISYLETLWQCLLSQTFRDYQCILVDDGSTDGSAEACDQICRKDSRFQVLHIQNQGVSHARNVGIRSAEGTYITFLDSDDEILPSYLEYLYRRIKDSSADMVIGSFEKFWVSGERKKYIHPRAAGLYTMEQLLPEFAQIQQEMGIYGYCWAKIFPRRLMEGLFFDENIRLAEDLEFYLRLYPRVKTVYLDDHPCYIYRQAAENSSALVDDSRIDYVTQLKINLEYRRFLQDMQAYSGKNQELMSQKINNYLYFSLSHCSAQELRNRISQLQEICRQESFIPGGSSGMQKMVLSLLRKRQSGMICGILGGYRMARNIRNKLTGR